MQSFLEIERRLFQKFTHEEKEVFCNLFIKMYETSISSSKYIQDEEVINFQDFIEGKSFEAHKYFGAYKSDNKIIFRLYAPNAAKISVIGEFNNWQEEEMINNEAIGVFSLVSEKACIGQMYKYIIHTKDGRAIHHSGPYVFGMELRPGCSSYIVDLSEYRFSDDIWMQGRNKCFDKPLNIYEVHLGSWKTKKNVNNNWYSYSEIVDELIAYVKEYGYSHIEIMPINEHPVDC